MFSDSDLIRLKAIHQSSERHTTTLYRLFILKKYNLKESDEPLLKDKTN